jgi:hypothetical protein
VQLPKEFNLVAACCRWPPSPERNEAVLAAVSQAIDWNRFIRIVRRHRVHALVNDAMAGTSADVPATVRAELREEAANVARESLLYAAESARLGRLLEAAGIEFLFLKGVSLAILAYGSLALKAARDIDLVVAPDAIVPACDAIAAGGYRRLTPGQEVSNEQFQSWVQLSKESVWLNTTNGIVLELHTGFVDSPLLLPALSIHSARQTVRLGRGIELSTLATDELFSYLSVHGATHAWSRLKWLADLRALLAGMRKEEVERLYRRSIELGAGRCSAQALLLCSHVLNLELPELLEEELLRDRINHLLVKLAIHSMAGQHPEVELDARVLGTIPIHLSHFLLGRGHAYKWAEFRRKLFASPDRAFMPGRLEFLFPLVALPRWLRRRARDRTPI